MLKLIKIKKEVINKLIDYMYKEFPNFKDNKYLSTLSRNRIIIYNLVNMKMYGIIRLLFFW
ncbi:MAG: hypothetical protein L6V91_03330 [Bacilli bacterium]|nr:MAG: hypothetical protein L6V91_03330 [Bacilli bacterium]